MKIEDGYLIVEKNEMTKFKKITGHSFVQLIGIDPFTKVGDCLLAMHGLYSEKVDDKWLKRGEFAEKIVQKVYTRNGHKITIYNKKEINYDNFQNYKHFGGLLDIELIEESSLIEVKSKSMKDYDYITKNPPIQEVYQGLYYGYLRKYPAITMEWIFFDEQTEQEVFNDKPITTLKLLKKHNQRYAVNNEEMLQKLQKALGIVLEFRETGKILLNDISDKVLKYLGLERPQNDIFDELPF